MPQNESFVVVNGVTLYSRAYLLSTKIIISRPLNGADFLSYVSLRRRGIEMRGTAFKAVRGGIAGKVTPVKPATLSRKMRPSFHLAVEASSSSEIQQNQPLFILGNKDIAIFLGTYNSRCYLRQQLASIENQSYPHWFLFAADDKSEDNTLEILHDFSDAAAGRAYISCRARNIGVRKNFLNLLCSPKINAPYYAFCDHDDIWEQDKLERAIAWLGAVDPETPAFYCSRTLAVSADNKIIGLSPNFKKPPAFQNALVQSLAGANTMVFNHAARKLAMKAGPDVEIACHDWWMYILVSGAGGLVHYDPEPTIRYRQHANNFIGANNSWYARFLRIVMLFKGRFKGWNDGHIASLAPVEHLLTKKNRRVLATFKAVRQSSSLGRVVALQRSGLYRQTWLGQIGLYMAAICKKL